MYNPRSLIVRAAFVSEELFLWLLDAGKLPDHFGLFKIFYELLDHQIRVLIMPSAVHEVTIFSFIEDFQRWTGLHQRTLFIQQRGIKIAKLTDSR